MKISKIRVNLILGSFELENAFVCPSRPTGSITKVLRDIHENFNKKHTKILNHRKFMDYAHVNQQNESLPALGLVNLKIACFPLSTNYIHY